MFLKYGKKINHNNRNQLKWIVIMGEEKNCQNIKHTVNIDNIKSLPVFLIE